MESVRLLAAELLFAGMAGGFMGHFGIMVGAAVMQKQPNGVMFATGRRRINALVRICGVVD
jgi:hypothetical protein